VKLTREITVNQREGTALGASLEILISDSFGGQQYQIVIPGWFLVVVVGAASSAVR